MTSSTDKERAGGGVPGRISYEPKMSYHDALNFLVQKTSVIELYDELGGRVAVCPEWNGRVMTSTCGGLGGDSFGFINVQAIDTDDYEDFGGEDQWTLSPLVYSFAIESIKTHHAVLQRTLRMADANGTPVEFQLTREIILLRRFQAGAMFDDAVVDALEQSDVSVVGFYSANTVRALDKACIACRQRGMYNATPRTAVIVPAPPKSFMSEPFSVDVDYLGGAPHGRIRYLSKTLLIRADGQRRCQVTMPFASAPPIFGALERQSGTLTLWTFDVPDDFPSKDDVVRIYNPGRFRGSEIDWTAYYEINCFSAARKLEPDIPLTTSQCTLHINADNAVLDDLIRLIFGVSLGDISRKMFW